MRRALIAAFIALLACPTVAMGAPSARFGIQDDAWLRHGPGTLEERLDRLEDLGVDLVRINVFWNEVQPTKGEFDWSGYDDVLTGLNERKIEPVLTLFSTPGWANGGRGPNVAPTSGSTYANFARTAAIRYPFVRRWLIWNEPNQRRWLQPTTPEVYVKRLLNPAYAAIHSVRRNALVAGGVTAPRASTGGVSPVAWIRGMGAAKAKLDAYAQNPYPLAPRETPFTGGCAHCETITLATLPRLLAATQKAFGKNKRIWLTEHGYQTSPPDRFAGVPLAKQAQYIGEAALAAFLSPRVDMLVQYLLVDEPDIARWQSGLLTTKGKEKPSYNAFRIPFAVRSQKGKTTTLWGQIRPGKGAQRYRLEQQRNGAWRAVGGAMRTQANGVFTRVVRAAPGTKFRIVHLPTQSTSAVLVIPRVVVDRG